MKFDLSYNVSINDNEVTRLDNEQNVGGIGFGAFLQRHETTNNDLRLCAYLRLNLSSKDIAPLLNISLSSVEIKRYRLRKKMKLSHGEGLTEHLLSL